MKIALGADSDGFNLKEAVKKYLHSQNYELQDIGVSSSDGETPYYQIAAQVGKLVATQQVERGVLVCGTGMGMAIIANKLPGVYAAVCENTHAAKQARSLNNANVLTLGEMFTTPLLAQDIIDIWLSTDFTQDWDDCQAWLENSMKDIAQLEKELFAK